MQALASLATVPILTRLLSPIEYGKWVLLEPLVPLIASLALLGSNNAIIKLVARDCWAPTSAIVQLLKFGFFPIILISSLLGIAVGVFGGDAIVGVLAGTLSCIEAFLLLAISTIRAKNSSRHFAAVVCLKVILIFGLLISAKILSNIRIDVVSQLLLWLHLPALVCVCFSFFLIFASKSGKLLTPIRMDANAYVDCIRYGLPITGASMAIAFLSVGDRYALSVWIDHAEIGSYVVLAKIANSLNFAIMPISLWFPAVRFKKMGNPDEGKAFFRDFSFLVFIGLFGLSSLVWLSAPAILDFLNPGQPFDPYVTGILLASVLAFGMSGIFNVGLLKTGKTKLILFSTLIAASVQLVLLASLVPKFGVIGAASSSLIGSLVGISLQSFWSQLELRVNHDWIYYFLVFLISFAILTSLLIFVSTPLSRASAFFVIYPCIAFLVYEKYRKNDN